MQIGTRRYVNPSLESVLHNSHDKRSLTILGNASPTLSMVSGLDISIVGVCEFSYDFG